MDNKTKLKKLFEDFVSHYINVEYGISVMEIIGVYSDMGYDGGEDRWVIHFLNENNEEMRRSIYAFSMSKELGYKEEKTSDYIARKDKEHKEWEEFFKKESKGQ